MRPYDPITKAAIGALLGLGMASLSAACVTELGAPASDELGEIDIVGGQEESGYPAVGALTTNGSAFCTATLIAPNALITAAHCIHGMQPSQVSFFMGTNTNSGGTSIQAASLHPHPQFSMQNLEHDIGVVLLSQSATTAPQQRPSSLDASVVGQGALLIGYGLTDGTGAGGSTGQKRTVTIPITQVDAQTIRLENNDGSTKNPCRGDSGGPAMLPVNGQMNIVGVTSYGDMQCTQYSVYTRIDAYESFVQGVLSGATPPPPSSDDPGAPPPSGDQPPGFPPGGDPGSDPNQDPNGDICAQENWYGDGICDEDCAMPDPDCSGQGNDPQQPPQDSGNPGDPGGDFCAEYGWYGDGICDEDCPQPDPDCN